MSDNIEVADVLYRHGDQYCRKYRISAEQLKVLNLIKICRTSALGGHLEQCDCCGYQRPAYNSCRNRHCPKCQTMAKEKWLNDRRAELLPCGYYHLVFTLPHEPNPLIMGNKKHLLGLLFKTAADVLQRFAKDPKWRLEGKMGFIGVLHTWSQILLDHFHLHCLVPAGVLAFDESSWIKAREKYLFKTQALAKAFKHRYIQQLVCLYEAGKLEFTGQTAALASADGFGRMICTVRKKNWIVYAKRPFAGPEQVLDYLGRYTHRVAISNDRIKTLQNGTVGFTYRDRADDSKKKLMTLEATEFIRRFLLHVLPDGFVKIRYFGFLAHRNKKRCIAL
ncbi:MAG: IS91 family transposase, partial [Aestuariibacter sp.]|nr:IS91 family transposase [Aestuariibacter sp.]